VPIEEFFDESGDHTVKIGDSVEVALDSVEDGFGETKLSREKARRARSWTVLEKAQEKKATSLAKSKVALPLKFAIYAHFYLVRWSTYALFATPATWKVKNSNSK